MNNSGIDLDKSQEIKLKKTEAETHSNIGKNPFVEESADTFYLKQEEIKLQLQENNSNLDQHLFIDQLVTLLNQMNKTEVFNRVLLMHVLEFGNINKETPINLKEFFKSYFSVIDNMRFNRNVQSNEIGSLSKQIERYRNKLVKHKGEILLENGLTSNSFFQFYISKIEHKGDYTGDKIKVIVENKEKSDSVNLNVDEESLRKKNKLKVTDNDLHIATLSILRFDENSKMWAKCIEDSYFNTVSNSYTTTQYNIKSVTIEISHMFILSKINHYQSRTGEVETKIEELKQNIDILDNSVSQLQCLFPKAFANPQQQKGEDKINEVSEKIEQIVLNVAGKNIILWQKTLSILNKCLIVACILMMIMFRADYATLIIAITLLGIELMIVQRTHYRLVLKALLASIAYDLLWILYYIFKYRNMSALEGDYSGTTYRKFTTILGGFVILMKLILLIAVLRITQLQRYNEINPEAKKMKAESKEKDESIILSKTQKAAKSEGKLKNTITRPTIRRDKTLAEGKVGLRDTEFFEKL